MTFGKTTLLKLERLQQGSSPERVQVLASTGQLWSGDSLVQRISMGGEKGREILLGDPHEVTQAVGPQCAGFDPAACGSRRDAPLALASSDAMVEWGKRKAAQSGRLKLPMKITSGLRFTQQGRRGQSDR